MFEQENRNEFEVTYKIISEFKKNLFKQQFTPKFSAMVKK